MLRAYLVGLKLLILTGDCYVKKLLLIPRNDQLQQQFQDKLQKNNLLFRAPDVSKCRADIPLEVVPSKAELLRVGHCETFYSI